MNKLGMSIMNSHHDNLSIEEQIALFARCGFESFFLSSGVTESFDKIPVWAELADKNSIIFEAVHAPTYGVNDLWLNSNICEDYINKTKFIIDMCKHGNVSKLIFHTAHGSPPPVSEVGLYRLSCLEEYAQSSGVHICYENADVAEHLVAAVLNCGDYHGFCLDTGHNLCYTPDVFLAQLFGNKLLYTHLHDNLGKQQHEKTFSDLHLLPLDGNIDWESTMQALANTNYSGTLNLELSCNGKAAYNEMSYEAFVKEAYKRVCMLKHMMTK